MSLMAESSAEVVAGDRWRLGEGDQIAPGLTAVKLLGGGSAYEAYLAYDELTAMPVVVKVVRPDQVADRHTLRGLRREIEILDRVRHPVVVRALRADPESERPHVVLEQVDGPRLSTLLRRYGPLQPEQYLPLAIEIAAALHYFRHIDVVHLDIKPSNIIMGAPARLIDLSVARTADRAARSDGIGTDAYMSPEQCRPDDSSPQGRVPGYASDVWGLGATLYEAICGYPAFDRGVRDEQAPLEQRYRQLTDPPYELPSRVPDRVATLIVSMLEAHPGDRPTPSEIGERLEPVLASLPRAKLTFKAR